MNSGWLEEAVHRKSKTDRVDMENLFYNWMMNTENKSPNTAYSYKNSISKISSHHSQATGDSTDIYNITDVTALADIANDYLQSPARLYSE